MEPLHHIIYSILFSIILFLIEFNPIKIFLFLFSAIVLIDLDHVLLFIFKKKSINPFGFWKWSYEKKDRWDKISLEEKRKYKKPIYIFHNIEFLLILILISRFIPYTNIILYGFVFHLFLDAIYNLQHREEKFSKISLIYTLVKNKKREEFR